MRTEPMVAGIPLDIPHLLERVYEPSADMRWSRCVTEEDMETFRATQTYIKEPSNVRFGEYEEIRFKEVSG